MKVQDAYTVGLSFTIIVKQLSLGQGNFELLACSFENPSVLQLSVWYNIRVYYRHKGVD